MHPASRVFRRHVEAARSGPDMFNFFPPPKPRPIITPCIGVCTMDERSGLCDGCARTLDEIARWGSMDEAQRRRLMDEVLPAREAARG
jgi:uncharacterized protein